jgi:hypothetical protein
LRFPDVGRSSAADLLLRLEARCDEALCFVGGAGVRSKNDRAEPDLRMVKVWQKIAGCKASEDLQNSA